MYEWRTANLLLCYQTANVSSADRNSLALLRSSNRLSVLLLLSRIVRARLAVKEAALLDGAAALLAGDAAVVVAGIQQTAGAAIGRGEMGDVLGDGVLGADSARVDAVALARLGHGVVAAVKVLALLEVLGEVVRL